MGKAPPSVWALWAFMAFECLLATVLYFGSGDAKAKKFRWTRWTRVAEIALGFVLLCRVIWRPGAIFLAVMCGLFAAVFHSRMQTCNACGAPFTYWAFTFSRSTCPKCGAELATQREREPE